jgi:hypothetical protein
MIHRHPQVLSYRYHNRQHQIKMSSNDNLNGNNNVNANANSNSFSHGASPNGIRITERTMKDASWPTDLILDLGKANWPEWSCKLNLSVRQCGLRPWLEGALPCPDPALMPGAHYGCKTMTPSVPSCSCESPPQALTTSKPVLPRTISLSLSAHCTKTKALTPKSAFS